MAIASCLPLRGSVGQINRPEGDASCLSLQPPVNWARASTPCPVSAIFISYTGHDPEGDTWADLLVEWFSEWEYGYFRDRDHSHGIKAGGDWRQTLYAELADARVLVCLCSKQYDSSPWCVGEVAIAVKDGKTVIPIQLATTAKELKTEPLPLLLQTKQAIKVADAANPSPKQLEEVKEQLQTTLQQTLNWRDLLHWDRALAPYPGLPAFEEHQAPVFFGRDKTIGKVVERLAELALRSPAFLLLLGASGYGKSSLVRAGVVPRLKKDPEQEWLVLPPFMPGDEPFRELEAAVKEAGGVFHSADPLGSIRELQRQGKRTLVVVIDQFEELLRAGPKAEGQDDQGEAFQVFLLQLLRSRKARLLVVATMRTDFLAPLQARWPALTGMATTITLEPIEPEDFGEVITGPADRSSLSLEAGLTARLVKDSGGRDALPLLAFTLEKLWKARDGQVLTVKAYEDLKGVAGAVSTRAEECWNPQTSSEEVRQSLREAFLDYLVSVSGDGQEAKRPAPLAELPIASREIVQRMVDDRLLVQKDGIVEIAHEALLRTWEPLVKWIEEGKEELLQCLRVKRLCEDLNPEAPERQRRQALEQLAALAASGGSEQRAVKKEASETLSNLISNNDITVADRKDVAVVLALIGSVQPLRDCLAAPDVPPILQQRIAESLGLLAAHCKNTMTTVEIQKDLAEWLESDPIDMPIRTEEDWEEHDARLPFLQGVSRGIQIAASAGLPMLGSGPGQTLPMLSICAKEESGALNIRSEIVTASVWKLPLPDGEWLELVEVPRGKYAIGSLPTDREHEKIRKSYIAERAGCESCDVEALRTVSTDPFMISRFPISRRQWSSVVNNIESIDVALDESPGTGWPAEIWDKTAEPGGMAVNYISWHECREWLHRLNNWITRKWPALGGLGSAPKLYLPSEAQWEVACRAGKNNVFHFGDTLDYKWARYDSSYAYGLGRRADKKWSQQGINGAFGLVNSFGLADLHGQVFEW
jgi:formylglycine-generating enzyme required for sulfatase activity